jgi:hypothetical protein
MAASRSLYQHSGIVLHAFYDETESGPSDYDRADLLDEKSVTVDENEEDDNIRDALKRELLLFSSVTNRGEYATTDEQVSAPDGAAVALSNQLGSLVVLGSRIRRIRRVHGRSDDRMYSHANLAFLYAIIRTF